MNDSHITSFAQLKEFAKFSSSARFTKTNTREAYEWINKALIKFRYFREIKKNKSILIHIFSSIGSVHTLMMLLMSVERLRKYMNVI